MNYIYLDNASTTFPKAPTVATAMSDYITNRGININRGSYALAYDVEDIIYTTDNDYIPYSTAMIQHMSSLHKM